MCYRETKLPEFCSQAENIANYTFINPTMPEDMAAYWDFDAPGIPNEPRDVSERRDGLCHVRIVQGTIQRKQHYTRNGRILRLLRA